MSRHGPTFGTIETCQLAAFSQPREPFQDLYEKRADVHFNRGHLSFLFLFAVGSGNFVAEGKRKQAWKLRGHVLVTTSSGYLAYVARLLTQLSLLHNKSQC
jgi:hypothetical protein